MDVKFGHIPGTRFGQTFKDRRALKDAGIHQIYKKGFGAQELVIVLLSCLEDMKMVKPIFLKKNQNHQIKNLEIF